MDAHVKNVVREMTRASDEERILFPEVVRALMEVGVERYHADFVCGTKTYFMPDGSHETISCHSSSVPARTFSAEAVEAAVRAIQRQDIPYLAFCERIAQAGCVGYIVSLAGRSALYYGRTNDSYVEPFPRTGP